MRSCVLRSPQRLTNASRSRSRTYSFWHELQGRGDGPARENVCEFATDYAVIFRSVAAANHHVNGELRAG